MKKWSLKSLFCGLSLIIVCSAVQASDKQSIFVDSMVARDGISAQEIETKLKENLSKEGFHIGSDKKAAKVVVSGRAFNADKNTTIVIKISFDNDAKVFAETEALPVGAPLTSAIQSLSVKIAKIVSREAAP
jgi:hypothetical protein